MADFQCGSCSYTSDDRDEAREHSREAGHLVILGNDGVETVEAAEAVAAGGKSDRARLAGEWFLVLGAVALGAALAATGKSSGLARENQALKSMGVALRAKVTNQETIITYLKSASGAGTVLAGYRGR